MAKSVHNLFLINFEDFYRLNKKITSLNSKNLQPQIFDLNSESNQVLKSLEESLINTSIFEEDKFIVIKGLENTTASNVSQIVTYLEKKSPNDFVICCVQSDKNIIKKFQKIAEVIEFKKLTKLDFSKEILEIIKKIKIDKDALDYLIDSCAFDLDLFEKRVDHLWLLFNQEQINKQKVSKIFSIDQESSIFELLNLIDEKNTQAIAYLNHLTIDISSVLGMISLFTKHYQELLMIKNNDLKSFSKTPDWLLKKKKVLASKYSENQIQKKLLYLLKADSRIKNQNLGIENITIEMVRNLCS